MKKQNKVSLEFKRPFVLFSYEVSHGLLLFRSAKSLKHATRLDVLFQDVRALETRASLNELLVKEIGPAESSKTFSSKPSEVMEKGHKLYILKCKDWTGFVVGGVVSYHEDNGEFFEKSALMAAD